MRKLSAFALTLLAIEFLDEFVYGAREAAWPLIRNDLGLTHTQVGLLLGIPSVIASLIEPWMGSWAMCGAGASWYWAGASSLPWRSC